MGGLRPLFYYPSTNNQDDRDHDARSVVFVSLSLSLCLCVSPIGDDLCAPQGTLCIVFIYKLYIVLFRYYFTLLIDQGYNNLMVR